MSNLEAQLTQFYVLLNSIGSGCEVEKKDKKLILHLNQNFKLIVEEKSGHRGTDWDTWTEVTLVDDNKHIRAKLEL